MHADSVVSRSLLDERRWQELKKAGKINPEEAQINFSLFECYRNIGRIEQADKELKKELSSLENLNRTPQK